MSDAIQRGEGTVDTPDPPVSLSAALATLRGQTPARVALDRTGVSLTTRHALDFALAHAQARDAVHSALDVAALTAGLEARSLPHLSLHSAAPDRPTYLRRPDLGRTLSSASATLLSQRKADDGQRTAQTLTILLADGLSATAANTHAIPLLDELLPLLTPIWTLTPIVVAQQARVALADAVGLALHAAATVILIGERPGLSSPDSLGAYITWAPHLGRTDAERNCVSNIRPPTGPGQAGLPYAEAARKIADYLTQARRLQITGTALRESDAPASPQLPAPGQSLL
jgi:ethanolamine ammonia-lyase small subunit